MRFDPLLKFPCYYRIAGKLDATPLPAVRVHNYTRRQLSSLVAPNISYSISGRIQGSTNANMSSRSAAAASHAEYQRDSLFDMKGRVALITGLFTGAITFL